MLQPLAKKYLLVPASTKIANVQNFLRKKLQLTSDTQVKHVSVGRRHLFLACAVHCIAFSD